MKCTISVWVVPILLNILMVGMVLRPYTPSGIFDPGPFERVLWIVPILLTWVFFFAYLWMVK